MIPDSAPPSANAYSYDTINDLIDEPMQMPGLYPLDRSLQVWIFGLVDPIYLCRLVVDEEMTVILSASSVLAPRLISP